MGRLSRLLQARSIAVIGGGFWCENVIRSAQAMGFRGEIFAVHPKRDAVAGVGAFRSVNDLPHAPDAAFIGVNREASVGLVRDLAAMGAGGAVVFASGFAEAEASDLQVALTEAAGEMPILGPNCYGFINYLDRALLWPDQHGGVAVDKGVAIIAQSSNIAINLTMQSRALPLAYVVTVGNQAQTGLSELGVALLDDARVTALGLHIEGIDDLDAFAALARRAHELGKPVVVLKVGATAAAQALTVSHTASLAGSDAGARALFARLGMAQVESLPAFLEALKLVHGVGRLGSNRIASMSCSGGEASLMADAGARFDVTFPALAPVQLDGLARALGPGVALSNPLDYHTYVWGDAAAMTDAFAEMMTGDLALGIVVLDIPRNDRCDPSAWLPVIDCVTEARDRSRVPMAVLSSLPETMPEDVAQTLIARGLVPLCGMDDALGAVAAVAGMSGAVGAVAGAPLPEDVTLLTEGEGKAELSTHGLKVPNSRVAQSPEDAGYLAAEIGFPVVLKGVGLAHKSEAGAVVLGLGAADAVVAAARAMPADSYLVEEMIEGAVAELLVGVVLDPAHGYVLTLAAGGVMTEILRDQVSVLLPVERGEIEAALDRLRIGQVLGGYRGGPAADVSAIVDAVKSIEAYVLAHRGQVAEVEVNPLLCLPDRAVAADALIRQGEVNGG